MSHSLTEQLPEYAPYADTPPCYDPEKALKDFNALTPKQKADFATGIALAVSSNETDQAFKKASTDAATAVQEIESLFIVLSSKFQNLGNAEDFVKTFEIIQKHYREVVIESHNLAVTISQYADSFDEVMVKFCADQNITVEERISKIKEFVEDSKGIKTAAGAMNGQFTELKNEFTNFVGTFSTWAKDQEEKDEQKIKDLYATIADLDEKLTAISLAITSISFALGATLPLTALLAIAFPPAAPIIIGVGLTIAGLELGSLVGLLIAQNILLNEKRVAEKQIKDLQDEISKIKVARTQLEKDGQVALVAFTDNISVIQNVWSLVVNDATDIQLWLERGAKDADYPEYMKLSLDKGVKVYSRMGLYLKDYADGVTELVKTFKN